MHTQHVFCTWKKSISLDDVQGNHSFIFLLHKNIEKKNLQKLGDA